MTCCLTWPHSVLADTFKWSGYEWRTRDSDGKAQGPGPNVFSQAAKNVFVDDDGNLHLKIIKNDQGIWTCAEIYSVESFGYGTYEWELATNYDHLAKNVVLGLFTYNSPQNVAKQTAGKVGDKLPNTPHEIDIEFTKIWGDANLFYTTHDPDVKSPGVQFFQALNGDYTTHRFRWEPKKIHWQSFHGHVAGQESPEHPIIEQREGKNLGKAADHVYTGEVIPEDLDERVHLNLWIFDQDDGLKVPSDGKPQEVVVRRFNYRSSSQEQSSQEKLDEKKSNSAEHILDFQSSKLRTVAGGVCKTGASQ